MSSVTAYLAIGMLAGFLFLTNRSDRIEPFRELRFPMRSEPRLSPLTGEQRIFDPDGVLIDQGSQAIRIGSSIQMYTNSEEVLRITPQGKILIGETETISPINSTGQQDKLSIKGSIVMTGSKVLESTPSSLTAYFYDQELGEYYDYGGIKIMDRSYNPGNSVYLLGEWLQLHLSQPTIIKSFSLRISIPSASASIPNILHLLGSTDGLKWYLITSQLNQSSTFSTSPGFVTYPVSNVKAYSYYRVVFSQFSRNIESILGPYLQIYGLQFVDIHDNPLPGKMNFNKQTLSGKTYTLSSSITTGNIASFVDGEIQSLGSSIVGLTCNQVLSPLNPDSYTVLTFPINNDYYLASGNTWTSSGLSTTLALITTTPFNSAVGIYSSYHGSYPVECMRIVHNGTSGMVGIGLTEPTSNLSVLGSFDTSYMSSNVLGTKVAINSTSANYLHFTSGISNSVGFSQILFHSSDGAGTGTNNYYDTSIVSYGGGENQNNKGTLALTGDTVQVGSNLFSYQGRVGVGTSTPSQIFQIYTPSNYNALTVNNNGYVGFGVTDPSANLSVLGSFVTSYMSSTTLGTKVAFNSASANHLHFSAGVANSIGFSQILFHSSDGAGTGTSNYYDTSIVSYGGGESQNNKGTLALTGDTVQVGSNLFSYQGRVGVGTSTPSQIFQIYTPSLYAGLTHTNGSCVLQTVLSTSSGMLGTTSAHSLSLMAGGTESLFLTQAGNVGVGTATPEQKLHLVGNQFIKDGSLFIGTDSLNNCLRLFQSSLGSYVDFQQNFFIRLNQSAGFTTPSYYTALSINSGGYVGIGTTNANKATIGGAKCYGLDVYGSSSREIGLLRLVNVLPDASVAKGSAIQFVTTHPSGQILQSQICGRSANDAGSRGCIDFWVKANTAGTDSADLQVSGSVDESGVVSGNINLAKAFRSSVSNSVGQLEIGVAAAAGHFSSAATAGDSIIRSMPASRNLMLASGGEFPAIFIQSIELSGNTRLRQSRVGIGSSSPQGVFSVYRQPQTIIATDVMGDNSIDRYLLHVSAGSVTNQKSGQNLSAPSILLQSGDMSYNGTTSSSASMEITGGKNNNGGVAHGLINFYTALSSSPTVVIGTGSVVSGAMTYFGYNSTYMNTSSMNISSYALSAAGNIISSGSFIATSDQRIKKNIVPVDADKALAIVESIKIYEYEMKDSVRDPGRKIGVIAQQVQEVIPEAVKKGEDDYVADLLAYVKVVYNDGVDCMIQLFDAVELEGEIRLVNERNEKKDVVVVKKVNNVMYQISELLDTERQWMVYGTLQKSILAVDKPMLGMLAISAIQQLSRELREVKDEIKKLWEVVNKR